MASPSQQSAAGQFRSANELMGNQNAPRLDQRIASFSSQQSSAGPPMQQSPTEHLNEQVESMRRRMTEHAARRQTFLDSHKNQLAEMHRVSDNYNRQKALAHVPQPQKYRGPAVMPMDPPPGFWNGPPVIPISEEQFEARGQLKQSMDHCAQHFKSTAMRMRSSFDAYSREYVFLFSVS